MNSAGIGQGSCESCRPQLDAYLDDALPPETRAEVRAHLDACADCRNVLAARRRVREGLRRAVEGVMAPPAFRERIVGAIRGEGALRRTEWRRPVYAIAAAVLLALGGWGIYRLSQESAGTGGGGEIVRRSADTSAPLPVAEEERRVFRIGTINHERCALRFHAHDRFTLEKMERELGPEYAEMLPIVRAALPEKYELTVGHHCTWEGREYTHFVIHADTALVTIAITRRRPGDTFSDRLWADTVSGLPVYAVDTLDGLQVAGFPTERFVVFVVSGLPRRENLLLASNLAPDVSRFLTRPRLNTLLRLRPLA